MAWGDALEYVIQTARALATAHARGMIHRDIKPSNICSADPDRARRAEVKVADFGLATSDEKAAGRFVGTPYYAAPEQIAGAAPDLRSDIYTLAITFHELLTGNVPFKADNLEAMAELAPDGSAPADRRRGGSLALAPAHPGNDGSRSAEAAAELRRALGGSNRCGPRRAWPAGFFRAGWPWPSI
jgi:serine/threonine protein kinase